MKAVTMPISASVRPATANMLNNLLGGWGNNFKKSDPFTIAHVEQAFDDAFNPALFELTEEQKRREAEDILRQRKFHEEEQERLRQQNDFMKHLEEVRPVLQSEQVTQSIEENARELASDFLAIFQRGIEVSMALNYARKMLSQDLGLDITPVNFPVRRILNTTRDISTIPMLSRLCTHYNLTDEQAKAVMGKELGKLYAPQEPQKQDSPLSKMNGNGPGPLMGEPKRRPSSSFPSYPFKGNSNVTPRNPSRQSNGDIGHVEADSRDDGKLADMLYELLDRGIPE